MMNLRYVLLLVCIFVMRNGPGSIGKVSAAHTNGKGEVDHRWDMGEADHETKDWLSIHDKMCTDQDLPESIMKVLRDDCDKIDPLRYELKVMEKCSKEIFTKGENENQMRKALCKNEALQTKVHLIRFFF